ncbi:hypothetical protein D0962_36210 [Leptolyngbyaceae cyanobacterium CCMR0082]|uniref:CRISPR-associated protein Cas5 n=1 Tax=Adonisia turfae CCMR0082 TaxID=2304604 RepID=A0A6M0SHZ8_9CYAN|nr:hypothetical protein [Adonisia turfae]NEZ68115.1 hypothetical protein [Adonisia turfae CCMR0082]
MYCVELRLQPTAALTFRILPGSILNIATYPFVPPTSLSGFLRRLAMLSVGHSLPETKINKEKPPTYLLPHQYVALGAYLSKDKYQYSGVHRTYRKGMREFTHDDFSKIYTGKKANFQLHTWEYLIAEELIGYVASESQDVLTHIQDLADYGCNIGKEGYVIVSEVSEIYPLERLTTTAYPSTLAPMDSLLQADNPIGGCDIYNLYRYNWLPEASQQTIDNGLLDESPTPVNGFIPFVAAYFSQDLGQAPTLDYYTNGDIHIPVDLVQTLRDESDG